jgi:hypothetical protein
MLEIIRKPGSATNQGDILALYKTGLWTFYIIKKHKDKILSKNLDR